jgi:hypothetical protein
VVKVIAAVVAAVVHAGTALVGKNKRQEYNNFLFGIPIDTVQFSVSMGILFIKNFTILLK